MVLELSFDSNLDDAFRYESDDDNARDAMADEEDSASLDTMIFNFRASSMKSTTAGREATDLSSTSPLSSTSHSLSSRFPSPPRSSKLKVQRNSSSKSTAKPTAKKSSGVYARAHISDESDVEEEVVKPMPKLTQIPKPKPSLLQIPKSKLLEISKPTPSAQRPVATKRGPDVRSHQTRLPRSPSPPKRNPSRTTQKKHLQSAPSSPPPSSLSSSPSSIMEDIEPPDTLGDDSIDNLIGQDIDELNRLISSGRDTKREQIPARKLLYRSPTSDDMTAALTQSTRFRKPDTNVDADRSISSLSSPMSRQHSPFKLQMPIRRQRVRDEDDRPPPAPPADDDTDETEDSFTMELRKLRESVRSQRNAEKKPSESARQEKTTDPGTEINAETAASIREVSNAIDEALLLALQPFERRRKEQAKEDEDAAEVEAKETSPILDAALPLATQAIVEQLDLAFGSMTAQRQAELKANSDAAAEAKAADKAKKKEAEAKKQSEERAAKDLEMEILSLIPMRGKLLASSVDVEHALVRLELAETQARQTVQAVTRGSIMHAAPKNEAPMGSRLENELALLRQKTMNKVQEIEQRLQQPQVAKPQLDTAIADQGLRRIDWDRAVFEVEERDPCEEKSVDTGCDLASDSDSFQEVLQRHVVENLDLTILKLRHVLSIDEKEAAEAEEATSRDDEARKKKQLELDRENARRKRELEDAEDARKRVMGVTSLDQIGSWVEEDARLRGAFSNGKSMEQILTSLDARTGALHGAVDRPLVPSFFDLERALERFDAIKGTMNNVHPNGSEQQQHGCSAYVDDEVDEHVERKGAPHWFTFDQRRRGVDGLERRSSEATIGSDRASNTLYRRAPSEPEESEDDHSPFERRSNRFHKSDMVTGSKKQHSCVHWTHEKPTPSVRSELRHLPQQHIRRAYPEKRDDDWVSERRAPERRRDHSRKEHRPLYERQRRPSIASSTCSSPPSAAYGRTTFTKANVRMPTAPRKHQPHERALIPRIQQQIEWFQRNRRQKDAWVKQRNPH